MGIRPNFEKYRPARREVEPTLGLSSPWYVAAGAVGMLILWILAAGAVKLSATHVCLANGWPRALVAYDLDAYCSRFERGSEVTIPVAEAVARTEMEVNHGNR